MKKRFWKTACILCLVPALLSGCLQTEPEEPDTSQLLTDEELAQPVPADVTLPDTFALPYDPARTLDPVNCADGMQQVVSSLLYEGLFALDQALEPQNVLCSAYTYDAETYTYVFTLRSGVTFSDGTELTAQDVVQTLKRAALSPRYGARLSKVSSITAGEGIVSIVLSAGNTAFPALLDIPIVKSGTEKTLVPIGTGPYLLLEDEAGARLSSNHSHWKKERLPVESIALSAAGDRDTMLYQFTSHDVQLITADLTGTTPISVTGNISFQDADTTILQYIGFNTHRAPFHNSQLRAALGNGINRGSVISACLSGHGAAAQFPISPVSPLYPAELDNTYSYDAFADAMERSGYAAGNPVSATLLVNSENSFKVAAATHIAQALSAFDLQIEVVALPWEEYTAALQAGEFDLYYGEVKLTADWDLSPLLGSGGALNYGSYFNPRTDLLLASLAAAEHDSRAAAAQALCAYLKQSAPILPVCFKSTSVLLQTGTVEGLTPTMASPFYDLPRCTFHLKQD